MKIYKSDIEQKITVCIYCLQPKNEKYHCCSENHFDDAYELTNGDTYLAEDVRIVPEGEPKD